MHEIIQIKGAQPGSALISLRWATKYGAYGSEEADPWWIFAASFSKPTDLSVVWSDWWRILWGKIKKLSSERFFFAGGIWFCCVVYFDEDFFL